MSSEKEKCDVCKDSEVSPNMSNLSRFRSNGADVQIDNNSKSVLELGYQDDDASQQTEKT